ncbi:class A beta-lactamase [Pararhizobium antarcticum]|uniref:Beta-lactamase n=1 Tax=Pararhizobium antarcticum TaxID=1798805 RepID=A0A657LTM1_9HYPH|nr:class A beta-lactamase [Pararhizobium antarcticum]OJF93877.1 class A beta-lactamase [Pararhizobium antarcticum]OJF99289.1 class A beta-lactamase [Rhizobium sp. 58]
MSLFLTRRSLVGSAVLLLPVLQTHRLAFADDDDIGVRLAALEKKTGGRLGVSVLDTETNIGFDYRETERFPMLSTFKTLAAACVLAGIKDDEDALQRRVKFSKADLVSYSPGTEAFADGEGMTLSALCDAAITLSDNTAGNLLLAEIGGPQGLTAWLRSIGDATTRLDRTEPTLNESLKGDPRDTTTPAAMRETITTLLAGDVLSPSARDRLLGWLVANKTGDARLRAGLPAGGLVGEKTGTTDKGGACDVGLFRPERRQPIFISAYVAEASVPVKDLNPVFAEIGRMVGEML